MRPFAILSLFLLVGCQSDLHEQLGAAVAVKTVAEQSTYLPDLPAECYRDVPHASRVIGQDAPVVARREHHQTDLANASKRRCVGIYTDVQKAHASPKT
jgi:hypothetical protein